MSEGTLHVWERRVEWPLTALAALFLVAYALPILDPDSPLAGVAVAVDFGVWAVFAVDYLVRLVLTSRRWAFVRAHLPDLLVVALPLVRPLRALWLVVATVSLGMRAKGSFRGRVVTYVAGSVILVTFVSSLAVLDAERGAPQANITSFRDALWWSVVTITTAGYGDRYPTTDQGRLVAVGLMVAGVALLGVVTATLASWFVEKLSEAKEETQSEIARLEDEVRQLRLAIEAQQAMRAS